MSESEELGKIVRELEERQHPFPSDMPSSSQFSDWLATLVARGGSDLLLVPGARACILVEGEAHRLDGPNLTGAEIEAAVLPALSSYALEIYREKKLVDSSYRVDGIGRFRINLHSERGSAAAAVRALPSRVPNLSELHLPPSVQVLARLPRGLVLIGGPAGSGKSTTLAALVNEINKNERRHVVIIEDPMEYEHAHGRSIIEQIVATTVSRISDSFPVERQNTIRQELAMVLAAVLTQILLRSKKGGRFPAAELLMVGYGARQHIRQNALQHLHQEITITKKKGSFGLEDSLVQLIQQGQIEREDAELCAIHPDDLQILLKGSR
jgi:twitching motility protein PilT